VRIDIDYHHSANEAETGEAGQNAGAEGATPRNLLGKRTVFGQAI
jgi:hypothetical protein